VADKTGFKAREKSNWAKKGRPAIPKAPRDSANQVFRCVKGE